MPRAHQVKNDLNNLCQNWLKLHHFHANLWSWDLLSPRVQGFNNEWFLFAISLAENFAQKM